MCTRVIPNKSNVNNLVENQMNYPQFLFYFVAFNNIHSLLTAY